MDFFTDGFDIFTSPLFITDGTITYTAPYTPEFVDTKIDKDWMPYNHFEYDPLWHKKFASIKYQMEKMWD